MEDKFMEMPLNPMSGEPKMEYWKPLLPDGQMETLGPVEVFAEDNLRKLSQVTGLPLLDDDMLDQLA